ncbi:MAG TPA: hypothetical protein VLU25_16545 [Acidobacteriota bacterium]|nr:hypothetical protein [Acidobacteriota bacterium]
MASDDNRTRKGGGQDGFSLLEALLALALGLVILSAFLAALQPMQTWASDLSRLAAGNGAVWTVPSLLAGWLAPAGNGRHQQGWPGVQVSNGILALQSDLEGAGSFPDGDLGEPFEFLRLRVQAGQLQVRSGRGFYQPVVQSVASMRVERRASNWLRLHLQPAQPGSLLGAAAPQEEAFFLDFALPNFRPNLFAEVER